MKKLFTFFLALVASVGAIYAQSGTCGDNLTWTYSNGTLTISGTGAMADYYYQDYPWDDYRSSIQSVIINDGVTSIGKEAFYRCSKLTSVSIPNSVTSIGDGAFNYCSSLKSIIIPNSVTSIGDRAFEDCTSLTSIKVDTNNPNYCSIDGVLFNKDQTTLIQYPVGNTRIEYIVPNSVTSIGDGAFNYCSSLTSINVDSNNPNYSSVDGVLFNKDKTTLVAYPGGKQGAYTIPNSVTSIGYAAFWGRSKLTSITIPNSVTSIGGGAFLGCSKLTSITIPNSVTSIGDRAFSGCYSLTSITIGNSVTSIGDRAFEDCTSLTSITIPNSVTSIGWNAFGGTGIYTNAANWENDVLYINDCLILAKVSISGAYTIKAGTRLIAVDAFRGCSSLTSVTIPNSVKSIGDDAFYKCSSLTSFTIPNSVTSIGNRAFEGCNNIASVTWNAKNCNSYNFGSQVTSFEFGNEVEVIPSSLCEGMEKLTSIAIPNSVKTIGASAFKGCIRLGKVSLGKNLETIGANAFAECTRLYDIYTYATYPPFAEESSFANYNVYVYIPCEYQRDYTLDVVWGKFKFIECISSDNVTTDEIVVTPSDNEVNVTWPTVSGAASYELVIKDKNGNIVCTLIFNANGQLTSIAFNAPSRNGVPAQTQSAGFSFTITGLDSGTNYNLTLTAKDNSGNIIEETTIPFQTDYPEGIEDVPSSSLQGGDRGRLILRDGQVLILRNGKTYTMQGQEVK